MRLRFAARHRRRALRHKQELRATIRCTFLLLDVISEPCVLLEVAEFRFSPSRPNTPWLLEVNSPAAFRPPTAPLAAPVAVPATFAVELTAPPPTFPAVLATLPAVAPAVDLAPPSTPPPDPRPPAPAPLTAPPPAYKSS